LAKLRETLVSIREKAGYALVVHPALSFAPE
jgi:hypothetical protein